MKTPNTQATAKLHLRIRKNIVSVCEPDGFVICMADGKDIVKWKTEFDALNAVAEAAKKMPRSKCSIELNSALIDLAGIRDTEHRKQFEVENYQPRNPTQ